MTNDELNYANKVRSLSNKLDDLKTNILDVAKEYEKLSKEIENGKFRKNDYASDSDVVKAFNDFDSELGREISALDNLFSLL